MLRADCSVLDPFVAHTQQSSVVRHFCAIEKILFISWQAEAFSCFPSGNRCHPTTAYHIFSTIGDAEVPRYFMWVHSLELFQFCTRICACYVGTVLNSQLLAQTFCIH